MNFGAQLERLANVIFKFTHRNCEVGPLQRAFVVKVPQTTVMQLKPKQRLFKISER